MALLPALLLLLLLLLPLAALVLGTVLLALPSYEIPPGVNQPAKLRLVLAVLLGTAAVVSPATAPRSAAGAPGAPFPGPGSRAPRAAPRRHNPAPRTPSRPSGGACGGCGAGGGRNRAGAELLGCPLAARSCGGRRLLGRGKAAALQPLLPRLTFLVQNPVRAALLNPWTHFYSVA